MIGYCSPDSLAFRLCVYFAANPGEELLSEDIRVKFAAPAHMRNLLQAANRNGLLAKARVPETNQWRYMAGPKLLELIGEPDIRITQQEPA